MRRDASAHGLSADEEPQSIELQPRRRDGIAPCAFQHRSAIGSSATRAHVGEIERGGRESSFSQPRGHADHEGARLSGAGAVGQHQGAKRSFAGVHFQTHGASIGRTRAVSSQLIADS